LDPKKKKLKHFFIEKTLINYLPVLTMEFNNEAFWRTKFTEIVASMSRHREDADEGREHWIYDAHSGGGGAISCRICGEYNEVSGAYLFMAERAKCRCKMWEQNGYYYCDFVQMKQDYEDFVNEYESEDEDEKYENWKYGQSGPHGPNGYDNDSDY
jgi:hypothetical protein